MLTCMLTLACQGADVCFISVEHKVVSFGCKQIGSFDQSDQPCIFASLRYLTGICVSLLQMSCRGGFRRGGCFSMCLVGWGENDAPLLLGVSDNLGLKHPLKKSHFIVFVFNWCSWDFIHNMYICLNVKDLLANTGKMCFSYVESNSGWY